MTQGAVSSRMPVLPVVHLAHLVETGTWFVDRRGGRRGGACTAHPLARVVVDVRAAAARCSSRARRCSAGVLSSAPTRSQSQRLASARGATWSTCGPAVTWRSEHGIASAR